MKIVKPDRSLDAPNMLGYVGSSGTWRQCQNCNVVLPTNSLKAYHRDSCIGLKRQKCDVCEQSVSVFWIDKVTPFTEELFYANICQACSKVIQNGPQKYPFPLTYYMMHYIRVWHLLLIASGLGLDITFHLLGLA